MLALRTACLPSCLTSLAVDLLRSPVKVHPAAACVGRPSAPRAESAYPGLRSPAQGGERTAHGAARCSAPRQTERRHKR
ncbi:Adenosylcobinamide-GDP ribazoletransferase [Clarias magur]|uniref:Adenosylcobinamide-GDP ribazoletransferase n=1 Tax=Clarias magur TaxID=1594786 RepID=A0A8J4X5W5_CLAMG|nr:Adenosylcobinamide-GDP ribazoletransferase [Clarias magur]